MTTGPQLTILTPEELPEWFTYPPEFLNLIASGITLFDPWWIFDSGYGIQKLNGLRTRYPERNLVPFARDQSNDDVACWEKELPGKVVIVHDFADPGWEARKTFDTFHDWFRSAIEDFIETSL